MVKNDETVVSPRLNDLQIKEINDKFNELKSKIKKDLLQYEAYQVKFSDDAKQALLEIAEIDIDLANIILKRYDSVSNLPIIKKAALLDADIVKQILSLHADRTIIERLRGIKVQYDVESGTGENVYSMVKALQVMPELNKFLTIDKAHIVVKVGKVIDTCGVEFLQKEYDDLDLGSKYKLLKFLMKERGQQNSVLTDMPIEVQKLFPLLPPCKIGGDENPQYIATIKKLHNDVFKDYQFSSTYVRDFNSSLNQFISCKKDSDTKTIALKLKEIFANMDLNYSIGNIENILGNFLSNNNIRNLSESEQKVFLICELLKNNSASVSELSKGLFSQLGFSQQEVNQISRVLSIKDLIKNLKNHKTSDELDLLMYNIAFLLKDESAINIADQLYKLSEGGITIVKDTLKKINFKIKSNNFAMPQNSKEDYLSVARLENVNINEQEYRLYVVRASELDVFNTYMHSIRGVSSTGASELTTGSLLEKYDMFENVNEDNVFCVTYITKDNIGVLDNGIGLLFEVPLEEQYLGAGYDIGSQARNVQRLLDEYYVPNSKIQPQVAWGMRENVEGTYIRQIVSSNLKNIMGISDGQYIQKWDNITKQLNGQQLTLENLEQIDSEMANAFRAFLSKANNAQEFKDDCVLRNSENADYRKQIWNEFLVGKPKISGIYINASRIEDLQNNLHIGDWLRFAEKNSIPIILLK